MQIGWSKTIRRCSNGSRSARGTLRAGNSAEACAGHSASAISEQSSGAKEMGHNYNQEAQGRCPLTGGYFPRVSAVPNCGSIFCTEVFHGHVRHPQPFVSQRV
jgi:hypothetical protein